MNNLIGGFQVGPGTLKMKSFQKEEKKRGKKKIKNYLTSRDVTRIGFINNSHQYGSKTTQNFAFR